MIAVRLVSPNLHHGIKPMIAAVLLAITLTIGVGTASHVSAEPQRTTAQPPVSCTYYSRAATKARFGFDPGPGGYWDCVFIDLDAPRIL